MSSGGKDSAPASRRVAQLCLIGALGTLAGCASGRGGPVAYNPGNFGAPDVQAAPIAAAQERIGPLDKLKISVFNVEAFTGEYQVDANGNIAYSLLGTVSAAGKTPDELARILASRLNEKLYRDPKVQVAIAIPAEQTVTVDGSVKDPGIFPIKGTTTLLRVVALAHGMAEDANPSRVIVFRTVKGVKLSGAFDVKAIRLAQEPDPTIYGNDVVIVDGSRARRLFKDILQATSPVFGILRPLGI
jgi:polysaccharide export outer membrane protein